MSTKKFLKLISSIFVALIATIGFSTSAAYAASPHYVKGPTATYSETDNSLTVSWKAAGLGNVESVHFELSGTVAVESQCRTKKGNLVQGVPKYENVSVLAEGDFPVRNGQTTGSLTFEPLSSLKCTGQQYVDILSVDFSNLVLDAPGIDGLYYDAF